MPPKGSGTRIINDMILTKHFRIGVGQKLSQAEVFLKRKWGEIEEKRNRLEALQKQVVAPEAISAATKILNKAGDGTGVSSV